MFVRALILFIALITAATTSRATVPIDVRAGPGVNRAAINLLKQAEEQLKNDDIEGAKRSINAALRSDPTFWPALYTRGKVYYYQHKCALAVQDCNEALRQNRTFIEASLLRAGANACLGKYGDALEEINHCISIHPRSDAYARALRERARIRATCPDSAFRDGQAAVKDAMNACKLMRWQDERSIEVLAMAYAETGDFDSAVRYAEQALATKGISPAYSKKVQRHLTLFRQHQPLRSSY
jgi:tetratricopeptide (TPR) repeat protein